MTQYVSEHFTWNEVISSQKAISLGIDNSQPPAEVRTAVNYTASRMEVVKQVLHMVSIYVDSWYRCLELNRAVGSKDISQHLRGEAVDFVAPGFGTSLEIARELVKQAVTVKFDQLIMEHTWVHISFCSPNDVPRGEVLSSLATGGYALGLTDKQGNPV